MIEYANHSQIMAYRTEQREKLYGFFDLSESGTRQLGRMLAANGLKLDLAKTTINGLCRGCREGA